MTDEDYTLREDSWSILMEIFFKPYMLQIATNNDVDCGSGFKPRIILIDTYF
jgi:hypothetical protein